MSPTCVSLRLLAPLFLSVLFAVLGCGAPPPDPTPAVTVGSHRQKHWAEQISAVRQDASTEIIVTSTPVTADELAMLGQGCGSLEVLEIAAVEPPTAAGNLDVLHALPHLRRVRLGFEANDDLLAILSEVKSLRALNLPVGTFTDAGLTKLVELPELELLRFHSPHVTDAGMQSIAAMPSLRFLHLIDVPVTDEGIAALHEMDQLESLYIDGGKCTDDGLRALLQALPKLHFHRDQLHLPDDPRRHPHE